MANQTDSLKARWGSSPLGLGWTSIPTTLLYLQAQKNLSPTEFCVLINLISHWWKKDKWPNPSLDGLATRIGVTKRTVQRSLAKLERKELIERTRSSQVDGRNQYDLSGLVDYLNIEGPDITYAVKRKAQKTNRKNRLLHDKKDKIEE